MHCVFEAEIQVLVGLSSSPETGEKSPQLILVDRIQFLLVVGLSPISSLVISS